MNQIPGGRVTERARRNLRFHCGLFLCVVVTAMSPWWSAKAQLDPIERNLIQLGYDQPLKGNGPQGIYAYYYYNDPKFFGEEHTLRLSVAPAYLDGELGFRHLLSPNTDVGIGVYGGAFGDNYYEVRRGDYIEEESFDGHGGGLSVSVYHLLNPNMKIPVNVVARGGFRYSTFANTSETADGFQLPADRRMPFVRAGIRVAGKEPLLEPDLGLELSVWYERQWRMNDGGFGFSNDRMMNSWTGLYWMYAGVNYTWTNIGHRFSAAITAGGSSNSDRFSAWRPGGVLPLSAEFPLMMPGYFYQELTAERFVHFYTSYEFPLEPSDRLRFRIEGAAANLDYLPGFEQPDPWQLGVGGGLSFTSKSRVWTVILRYGYGINAVRDGERGSHTVGLLLQYNFGTWRCSRPEKAG